MSLINDMLKDLGQRNVHLTGRSENALHGLGQDDFRIEGRSARRLSSKKFLYAILFIILAGMTVGGAALLQITQGPYLSRFDALTFPKSQQAAMTSGATPLQDVDARYKGVTDNAELASVSPENSHPHTTATEVREAAPHSPSTADSTKRLESELLPSHSRLNTVILPRYIQPLKTVGASLEASVDAADEDRPQKKIEPIAAATQDGDIPPPALKDDATASQSVSKSSGTPPPALKDNASAKQSAMRISGTPPRALKDDATASQSVSSGDTTVANEITQIEVTHRPLSVEQQLLSDFHVAASAYKEGKYEEAERLLEGLLARDNGQHKARLLLARLYAQQKLVRRAELVLSNGLLHYPLHAPYVSLYAQMLAEQGRDIAAIDVLQNALPGASDNAGFNALLAGLYQRNGNAVEAVKSYLVALRLEPTRGEWWMGLGVSSEQAGDEDTALKAYNEALQHRLAIQVEQYADQRLQQLNAKSVASNSQDNN